MDLDASRAELEARVNLATVLLGQSLAEAKSIAAHRDAVFAERARIILELDRINAAAESRAVEIQRLAAELQRLEAEAQRLEAEVQRLEAEAQRQEAEAQRQASELAAAVSRNAELDTLLQTTMASTSWRITRPLRWAARCWATLLGRAAR